MITRRGCAGGGLNIPNFGPGGGFIPTIPDTEDKTTVGQTVPTGTTGVILDGGDFVLQGAQQVTAQFALVRANVDSNPVNYQLVIDGVPVGPVFSVASSAPTTVSGFVAATVGVGTHILGIRVTVTGIGSMEFINDGSFVRVQGRDVS